MANNRICLCCKTAYEYCGTCRKGVDLPAWRNLFDTENCKDVFQIVSDYEQKAIDKAKAKKMLETCDTKQHFKTEIKKVVDEILEEEKKPVIKKTENKKVDVVKVSD